jgi:leader peptidase (prepilin peptidase)/N-methyltransferase
MEMFYEVLFFSFLTSTFFLLLHLVTRGRGMGLGDAKLVLALSPILVWQQIVAWLFLSFAIGAVVGLALISFKKASFGKKIAFGPFLITAFFATLFWGNSLVGILLPWL